MYVNIRSDGALRLCSGCPGLFKVVFSMLRVGVPLALAASVLLTAGPVEGVGDCGAFTRESTGPLAAPSDVGSPAFVPLASGQTITGTVPQQGSGWAGDASQPGQQEQSGWSSDAGQTPQPQAPQPRASASATEAVAPAQVPSLPDWPLLVWDDFSDPATAWMLWNKDKPPLGAYTDGMMQVAFESQLKGSRSPFSVHEYTDFRVDVDVQTMGADEGVKYGLMIRYGQMYEDRSYYYYFRVGADGTYDVHLRNGTESTVLHEATRSSCFFTGPGAVNHLTAVAAGPRMDFYANGCFLVSVANDSLTEGDIGLVAGRLDTTGPVDVRFDNFRVYAPRPAKAVVWGDVSNSPFSKEELIARGEFLHIWPYPAEPVARYPAGTKNVYFYTQFEGMTSAHKVTEVALLDGEEVVREEVPWAHYVADVGHLGFGVFMRDYHMKKGSDLPTGHWEVRWYVEDIPVARTFFSIGVDTPPPTPEPFAISSAPALPPPTLPPVEESFGNVMELYSQGRYLEALPYCELAMAAAPNSTQLMAESSKCYQAAGKPEWALMLRTMAENLASKRADVVREKGQVEAPAATRAPAAVPSGPQEVIGFHSNADGNWEIYLLGPDGSGTRRLTQNDALDAALRWSPDGRRITFTSDREGNRDVFVMNSDGSGMTNVSRSSAVDSDSSWWPDGSKIVFESARSGDYEIWVMGADGSNPVNLSNTTGGDGKPVVSPDGTRIAFESARDGNVEIYVMNADGSGQVNLTNNPATDQRPEWSPDGSRIAFHSDRDGNAEVYVMNADGTNPVNVTRNPATDKQPVWSPDGLGIAFNSDRGGTPGTYVMDADGSGVTMVIGGGNNWATDWAVASVGIAPAASPAPPAQPPAASSGAPGTVAQPTSVALAGLPYSEDFSDPNSGWTVSSDEKRTKGYKDGEYEIHIYGDDYWTYGFLQDAQWGDFTAQVDMRQISDVEEDAGGMVLRRADQDNYYRVEISSKGSFRMSKTVNGTYIRILPWTKSPAVLPGQATNRLKVTCAGDLFAIFINGQHVATVRDGAISHGQVGLIGQAFTDKPNAHLAFDNLVVTTAEEVPAPLFAPLPLADDFSDPNSGWPEESNDNTSQGYRDGEYHIHIPGDSRWTYASLPDATWGDFTVEVDVRQVSDVEDDTGGLILRRVDNNNYYEVSISPRGYYRVRKRVGKTFSILQPWTESAAIQLGQATNRLKVICKGDRMAVFINGQHVTTLRDKTFMQGRIGLRAEAFGGKPNAHLAFDNLSMTAATDVPPHPQERLPLADDFSDPNSGWPTQDDEYSTRGYNDGAYQFLKKTGSRSWSLLQDRIFSDFVLEVDATKIGGPEGGEYGVVFRAMGNKDYYMFQVSPDGTVSVQKKADGEYTDLISWQGSSAVNQGQTTNRLKVVCRDTDCSVFVNDQQVGAFSDDTFLQGKVGLVVGHSHKAEGTLVNFDNLRIGAP